MSDCSKCKFCEEDYIFDEEDGEEYQFYICSKGNDTSLDFECKDFKEYKPRKSKEKDTKCDKCNLLDDCIANNLVIDCSEIGNTRQHYICGSNSCKIYK